MIDIAPADFSDVRLLEFLDAHLVDLAPTAPPESRHALAVDGLRGAGVQLWVAHSGPDVVGTVALAAVDLAADSAAGSDGPAADPRVEELKSMRTDPARRGEGIGARLLQFALEDARSRGVEHIVLETGSADFFIAARSLYGRAGFSECGPFGNYRDDPHSVFMELEL